MSSLNVAILRGKGVADQAYREFMAAGVDEQTRGFYATLQTGLPMSLTPNDRDDGGESHRAVDGGSRPAPS